VGVGQGIGVTFFESDRAHVPGTQKPGFPLQFLGIAPQFLRDFRFNLARKKDSV
jgi:hypothetical protein